MSYKEKLDKVSYKEKLNKLFVESKWVDKTVDKEQPKFFFRDENNQITVQIKKVPYLNNKDVKDYSYSLFVNKGKKGDFSTLKLAKKQMGKLMDKVK